MANSKDFIASAESPLSSERGTLHVRKDGSSDAAVPHRATEAMTDGEHERFRVLAVKLDLRGDDGIFARLKELSWQAARYRNLQVRARWAEAKHLRVDPEKVPDGSVVKWIRHDEKMELSGAVYAQAEREVQTAWKRLAKRILAGAPLPEWKPTGALTIRGHRNRSESGVRLVKDGDRYIAELAVQAHTCEGGCWLRIPIAAGTVKDYQAPLLDAMCEGTVSIRKGSIVIKPERHQVLLRLAYPIAIKAPVFGQRKATLGPIGQGQRLWLRTEYESRDFSGRLHTLLQRKADWDLIRRRVLAQIGRRKGSARRKRQLLSKLSWDGWLQNWLHQWSHEVIEWLSGQGIGELTIMGLEAADWPAFRFTQLLRDKGERAGLRVQTEASLASPASERAVKGEISRKRRRAKKAGDAIRELTHQIG